MGMPKSPYCSILQLSVTLPIILPQEKAIRNSTMPAAKRAIFLLFAECFSALYEKIENSIMAKKTMPSKAYTYSMAMSPSTLWQPARSNDFRLNFVGIKNKIGNIGNINKNFK